LWVLDGGDDHVGLTARREVLGKLVEESREDPTTVRSPVEGESEPGVRVLQRR
jgi:hypothetical protein